MSLNPFARSVRYRAGLPVLPGGFPLLGHMPLFYRGPLDALRQAREKLGPLFWMNHGFDYWMVMCAAREGFEVLKSKASSMAYAKKQASTLLGESLLGQDGAIHQRMRLAMNPPFTPRGLAATGFGTQIAEIITARVERWAHDRRITVLAETQEMALEIIFRLIGVDLDEIAIWGRQYREFLLSAIPPLPAWLPGSPTRRSQRARAWLDVRLLEIVRAERARPRCGTVVSELAHGSDEQGQTLSDVELIDNLRLLTLAGHDTTANTLAWLTITLAQRPELWDALCDEASALRTFPVTPQDVRGFPFAEALFRETLRLYPAVAHTSRQLLEPMTLFGHRLPEGTIVAVPIQLLARDPELYPDPDRCNPSRWLNRVEPLSPIETSQFGGGPHFCLGYHLAWMEAVQFALALAQRMARAGLRPRLADGPAPHHYCLPLGHPTPATRLEFV